MGPPSLLYKQDSYRVSFIHLRVMMIVNFHVEMFPKYTGMHTQFIHVWWHWSVDVDWWMEAWKTEKIICIESFNLYLHAPFNDTHNLYII